MVAGKKVAGLAHRTDIQGLRAVAVLLVALGHAGISALAGGYVGVDVFFVLSGFLITGLLLSSRSGGRSALVEFYGRRARRILPAATVTLVATAVVSYQLLNVVRAKQVLQDTIPAALFFANIHFASSGTDYFAQGQPPSPLQHFWSLSVEEQFYVVWPAIALAVLGVLFAPGILRSVRGRRSGLRNSRRDGTGAGRLAAPADREDSRGRLLVVVAVIAIASLAWSIADTSAHPSSAYFSTLTRAWELALGAILAVAAPRLMAIPERLRVPAGWLGLLAIAVAAVAFNANTPFPGAAALLPTFGAALVIGAGIGDKQPRLGVGRLLALRPLPFIGDRSYAFYLWHWPALIIALQYEGHSLSVGTNLLLLAGAFLLSMLSYSTIENPIRRTKRLSATGALVLWPVCAIVATMMAGWLLNSVENRETALAAAAAQQSGLVVGDQQSAAVARANAQQAVAASIAGRALPQVQAAVNRGAQKLPSALSPPVDQLLADHYNEAGCAALQGQTSSSICRLGRPGASRTVVMFGDSHALMWMPTLLGLGQADGWTVIPVAKSGCIPSVWIGGQGQTDVAECHAWYSWATAQVKALKPDVALVAGSISRVLGAGLPTGLAALKSTVTTLQRYAKRVVLLNDIAGVTKQPVDCLLAAGATYSSCSSTLTNAELAISDQMSSIAHSAGAGFIDPTSWFCYSGTCPTVIGNTIAYLDYTHVSVTYARQLVGPFRVAFRRAVGQTR